LLTHEDEGKAAGSRQQAAGSRQQAAGSRQQAAGSCKLMLKLMLMLRLRLMLMLMVSFASTWQSRGRAEQSSAAPPSAATA
jgi:hypothetical protein